MLHHHHQRHRPDRALSMVRRYGPALAVLVLVILMGGGLWWYKHAQPVATTLPPSPYGLTAVEQQTVLDYFAAASARGDFEVTASTLHRWLLDKKPVLLIDVRQPYGPDGFDQGHIPGAVNIPLQLFGQELLAAAGKTHPGATVQGQTAPINFFRLPRNEPIVVMCYDGDGGEMTPALLRLLGYQAFGLRWGVAGWNQILDVWPNPAFVAPFPVARGASTLRLATAPSGPYQLGPAFAPALAAFYNNLNRVYPPGYGRPWTISAAQLYSELRAPDPPVVVDLRSPSAYAAGHIPGSLNIPFQDLGGNLNALPGVSRKIVLVSATLQASAQACAILRILGYRAYVLKQGLATWNPQFPPPANLPHYPLVMGAGPQ